jgi:hypothetical protein
MKTAKQQRSALHGRKIVLTMQERINLDRIKTDYEQQGYPSDIALERAWDFVMIERQVASGTFRSRFL